MDGWFKIWDLAKPVIAQVHGYCLAGGSELATACDLVYVADDAQIGYPPVRLMSPPDMQFHPWLLGLRRGMELMLTGTEIQALGFHTRSTKEYFKSFAKGVTKALDERDAGFGDYRTRGRREDGKG